MKVERAPCEARGRKRFDLGRCTNPADFYQQGHAGAVVLEAILLGRAAVMRARIDLKSTVPVSKCEIVETSPARAIRSR